MTLLKRILLEKRAVVLPLALVLLATSASTRSSCTRWRRSRRTPKQRAAAAAQSLRSAQRDLAAARALATGKSSRGSGARRLLRKVLPGELTQRRCSKTYVRVPALARKLNVKFEKRDEELEKATTKDQRFGRIKTRIVLQGDYEAIRRFIYELETAPEFVIIDDVALAQSEADKPLTLTLALSTYFRLGADGT